MNDPKIFDWRKKFNENESFSINLKTEKAANEKYVVTESGRYQISWELYGSFNGSVSTYLKRNDQIVDELHSFKRDFKKPSQSSVFLGKLSKLQKYEP